MQRDRIRGIMADVTDSFEDSAQKPDKKPRWHINQRRKSRRFVERYERRMEKRRNRQVNPVVRPFRVVSGLLLILTGIAIGWLPGPGFVILALPGAFLLASEIRRAAIILDRMENETIPRVKLLYAHVVGNPRRAWVEEDPEMWVAWTREAPQQDDK